MCTLLNNAYVILPIKRSVGWSDSVSWPHITLSLFYVVLPFGRAAYRAFRYAALLYCLQTPAAALSSYMPVTPAAGIFYHPWLLWGNVLAYLVFEMIFLRSLYRCRVFRPIRFYGRFEPYRDCAFSSSQCLVTSFVCFFVLSRHVRAGYPTV